MLTRLQVEVLPAPPIILGHASATWVSDNHVALSTSWRSYKNARRPGGHCLVHLKDPSHLLPSSLCLTLLTCIASSTNTYFFSRPHLTSSITPHTINHNAHVGRHLPSVTDDANIAQGSDNMANNIMPTLSSSQSQTSPALTAANLAAHERAIATNPSTTSSQGGWVCGGEMNHRRAPPNPEQWDKLVKKDPLAADIEEILRAAANARQNQSN